MRIILTSLLALSLFLMGCTGNTSTTTTIEGQAPVAAEVSKADASYAFGISIGESLKGTGVSLDVGTLADGIRDILDGKTARFDRSKAEEYIQKSIDAAKVKLEEDNKKIAGTNLVKEKEFLESNAKRTGIVQTSSGLQYEVIQQGSGSKPMATDTVTINYVGTLIDGKEFDSSVKNGTPATLSLDRVIPGFTEALQLMQVGSKFKFYIPSQLAYGERGGGQAIPPNSPLIFDIDLISIAPPAAGGQAPDLRLK